MWGSTRSLHTRCQTSGRPGANIAGSTNNETCRRPQVPFFQDAHSFEPLNDKGERQRIACGEDSAPMPGEAIDVALDEDGAESAEAHDLRSFPMLTRLPGLRAAGMPAPTQPETYVARGASPFRSQIHRKVPSSPKRGDDRSRRGARAARMIHLCLDHPRPPSLMEPVTIDNFGVRGNRRALRQHLKPDAIPCARPKPTACP